MDLSKFDTVNPSSEGVWMPVLDFDMLTPIGCDIRVLGPDSVDAVRMQLEQDRENQKLMVDVMSGVAVNPLADEDVESRIDKLVEKAVSRTLSWRGVEWNGETLDSTKENYRKVYRVCPHIRDQVLRCAEKRERFTSAAYEAWKKGLTNPSTSTPHAENKA